MSLPTHLDVRKPVHLNPARVDVMSKANLLRAYKASDLFDVSATVLDGRT